MHRFILLVLVVGCGLVAVVSCIPERNAEASAYARVSPSIGIDVVDAVAPDMPSSPPPAPTAAQRAQSARALILDQLRDPAGARFRNERVLQGGEVVCVEVAVDNGDFFKAVVIKRPDRTPSVWIDRGRELVAHTACELA